MPHAATAITDRYARPERQDIIRVEGERVAAVFERLRITTAITVVNASLIVFVIGRHGRMPGALIWLACIGLLATIRLPMLYFYRADSARLEHNCQWGLVSILGALLSGVAWGLGPVLLVTDRSLDYWPWSIAIGGMCAGAVSMHAAHPSTAFAFTYPACFLTLVSLFLHGGEGTIAVAGLIVAFLFVTTDSAWRYSRQFGVALSLRYALERRTGELDQSNQQLRDEIVEHRKTADNLFHAEKMEALGKVAGGIAHDFNNLLTTILACLDNILKHPRDAARVEESANLALDAANGGAQLAIELLSFSRKDSPDPVPASLNHVIEQLRPLLVQAIGRSATLDIELSGDAMVVIDVAHFQSALINLVANARDAMTKPGRILIRTARVVLEGASARTMECGPGAYIRVDVIDTGAGMPPEVAAKAFDPFFTTKGAGEGTGLGLSRVYSFARQTGGTARIESRLGEGTSVTLFIPASEIGVSKPAVDDRHGGAPDVSGLSGLGRRALLVDDNAAILMMLRAALNEEGWEVLFAQDGETALDILGRDGNFDLLITDIDMPKGMSGLDLVERVRADRPHMGLLLISGATVASDELPPGVPFLSKPFRPRQFLAAVDMTLAAASLLAASIESP